MVNDTQNALEQIAASESSTLLNWWLHLNVTNSTVPYIVPTYESTRQASNFHGFYEAFGRDNTFLWESTGRLAPPYLQGLMLGAMVFLVVGLIFLLGPLLAGTTAKICYCCRKNSVRKLSDQQKTKVLKYLLIASVLFSLFGISTLLAGFVITNADVAPSVQSDLTRTGDVVVDANSLIMYGTIIANSFLAATEQFSEAAQAACPDLTPEQISFLEGLPQTAVEVQDNIDAAANNTDLESLSDSLYSASHLIDISDPYRDAAISVIIIILVLIFFISMIAILANKELADEKDGKKVHRLRRWSGPRSRSAVYFFTALAVIICTGLMWSVVISGMLLGDYCQTPDQSTMEVSGTESNSLVLYYMTCNSSVIEIEDLENAQAELYSLVGDLGPLLFYVQNGNSTTPTGGGGRYLQSTESNPYESCSDAAQEQAQQLADSFRALVILVELALGLLSCPIINAIYVDVVYSTLCDKTIKAVSWLLIGATFTTAGFAMLTVTLTLYTSFAKQDRGAHALQQTSPDANGALIENIGSTYIVGEAEEHTPGSPEGRRDNHRKAVPASPKA